MAAVGGSAGGFLSLLVSFTSADFVTVLFEVVPRASASQGRIEVSASKLPVWS